MTDTGAYTDVVFGLFWLLGYRFSPRIADIGGARYWNTLYINAALEQLAREGHHLKSEDVARLSPLVFEHINLLGRYAFSVPEAVTRGELRPLRKPAEVLEEVA